MKNIQFYFQSIATQTLLPILMFSISMMSYAQDNPQPVYPAAGNTIHSEKAAAFISLFESTNVGNLHLFVAPSNKKENKITIPHGAPIATNYNDFFDFDRGYWLANRNHKAYAVYSIRGEDEEYYIIRFVDDQGNQSLEMYELNGEQLDFKKKLAYLRCYNSTCHQMDSWLQDIDGDTRIDVIQKYRNQSDAESLARIVVLQQSDTGKFLRNNDLKVDAMDYKMYDPSSMATSGK